jgi:hypothetical protein
MVKFPLRNLKMARKKATDNIHLQMEKPSMVSGKMERKMDMEFISIVMIYPITVNGKIIN